MAETEPIETGVQVMPRRSAVKLSISGWARNTSFIFIDTFRFCIDLAISGGHYATALILG